jgi:hypothetical protein
VSVEHNGTFDDERFHDVSPRRATVTLGKNGLGQCAPRHKRCDLQARAPLGRQNAGTVGMSAKCQKQSVLCSSALETPGAKKWRRDWVLRRQELNLKGVSVSTQ